MRERERVCVCVYTCARVGTVAGSHKGWSWKRGNHNSPSEEATRGCFCKLGALFVGVLGVIKNLTLPYGVCIRAPDFGNSHVMPVRFFRILPVYPGALISVALSGALKV